MWCMIEKVLNSTVLEHVKSYTYEYYFERYVCVKNISFSLVDPLPFFVNPRIFKQKKTADKDIAAKKESMVKLPVELP